MKSRSFVIASFKCLTVVALLAVPMFAQSRQVREQAKTLQDQGDRSFAQKNYRDAADKYGQALVLIPNNAYGHYRKGFAHFNLQERDQAISEFTIALSQGFRPVEVFRVRAFIYFEQKNYDAALDDIKKGLVLAPKDILFLKGLGEVYLAKNDFQQAVEALRRAADVAPNDADVQYNMARVHFATGDVKAQQTTAESALAKGTRFPGEAHYLLADAYQKQGNASAAIASYQRAISSKPDIYQAHRNLADVFRNEGRFNDAITTSKQALITFPNDGNIYTDLSWYYSLADRAEDAVQAAKAGVQLLPNQFQAYTNLCRAHNQKQEYALAVNACNGALRLQPNDGETFYYLGNALVGQDKSVEATRMYTRAVTGLMETTAKNPGYSDAWYLLGNASFADKQYDKAIAAYSRCIDISPKFAKAYVNLGITYTRTRNKAGAFEAYRTLLSLDNTLSQRLSAEIIDRLKVDKSEIENLSPLAPKPAIPVAFTPPQQQANTGFSNSKISRQEIVRTITSATVWINVRDARTKKNWAGSGFFVSEDVVATNFHVVSGATEGFIKILGQSGTYQIIGTVGLDEKNDLALVKISGVRGTPLSLAGAPVAVGDDVFAVGNPEGLEGTFSTGIVSGIRKEAGLLQITAPISRGSSGGAILNDRGEVVGVAVGSKETGQALNFAIPVYFLRILIQSQTGTIKLGL